MSRQIANRSLLQLDAAGLLIAERGGITTTDLERLADFEA
jgi:hypothetical protein